MATVTDRLGGVKSELAYKAPCRVATTANITLSGLQTIDGVTLAANDRVLVKNQTTGSENGIYDASTGSWTRSKDFDANNDVVTGTRVAVNEGTVGIGEYKVTTANPITIGTSTITWILSVRDASEPGFKWIFDTGTTDADPGSGKFRLNNATIASATALYVDNLDVFGATVTSWLDSLDDSTSSNKGTIKFQLVDNPTVFAMFTVSGSVVDGTGYRKITLASYLAGNGSFTAGDTIALVFQPSGSAGSVTGPATTVVSHIPQWSNVSGTLVSSGIPSTSVLRTTDIGSTATNGVQAYDAATLKSNATASVSVGYPSTSKSLGTSTSGTVTLDLTAGHFQHLGIGGAVALAPQTAVGTINLEILVTSTAASLTSTAYTYTIGSVSQTSGHYFLASSMRNQNTSLLAIQPLQTT